MPRSITLLVCAVLVAAASPAAAQSPEPAPIDAPDRVVIEGRGSFHGLGMAMDGVEGQARAGWSHDRIMSLFYPGTSISSFNGTIRVGLGDARSQTLTLPSGGTVGGTKLPAGASLTVTPADGGRLTVRISGLPKVAPKKKAAATPTPTPRAPARATTSDVIPPSPGIPTPTPTPNPPSPTPPPAGERSPQSLRGPSVASPLTIAPHGQPALTRVSSTGRRYRGTIELRRTAGGVRVINRVTLDDYVSGIAEEKGQGWPIEGLKTLAVAARSLAAATMTWHDNNHGDGYDICPTDRCQVYLGYDGEEPAMRQAAYETSGKIRTYNGRPILAMYFGNGGGQTASYRELSAEGAGNSYPYLTSVKYPYADPWHWKKETTLREISEKLRGATGDKMPSPLKYVIVLKRGESPRVKSVGLFGEDKRGVAVTGRGFAAALDLPSPWFYVRLPWRAPSSLEAAFLDLSESSGDGVPRPPRAPGFPWPLALLAGVLATAAALGNWTAHGGAASAQGAWKTLRGRQIPLPRRRRAPTQPAADASASG